MLSACGSDSNGTSGSNDSGPSPAFWPSPSGDLLKVDSLDTIDGAERAESDGVSLLRPTGWDMDRHETDQLVQIVVAPPDRSTMAIVTITATPGDADAAEASSAVLLDSSGQQGSTDLVKRPVQWPGWQYATAVTGVANAGENDFLAVTLLSRTDKIVTVVARAPAGTLDESLSYQVLRSLKDVG